jgi:hypothetical protein
MGLFKPIMEILGAKRAILERRKEMIDVIKAQDRHFAEVGW